MISWNGFFGKSTGLMAAAAGLTVGLMVATPATASADDGVNRGQLVNKSGLRCGGQERITGSAGLGPVETWQYSWIYYNCSDRSLRRKANINNALDGDCYGIGPGQARVLHTMVGLPIEAGAGPKRYKGTKAC